MPADWVSVENALAAAIRAATGLGTAFVFWAAQNNERPASTASFVTMQLIDTGSSNTVYDDTEILNAPVPAPGAEILVRTNVQRECVWRLLFYTPGVIGSASATALAAKVYNYLANEIALDTLDAAGVAVFDRGATQTLPDIFEEGWEGRAVLDISVRFMDGVDIPATFIETVIYTGSYVP